MVSEAQFQYFISLIFGGLGITGIALGYLASYLLLTVVAYLSLWVPLWMWIADVGLFSHSVAIAASGTVGVISAIAWKLRGLKLCSSLLVGLVLLEVVVTVQLTTRRVSLDSAVESDLKDAMGSSLSVYNTNISDTQMWDEIQLEINCCGVHSYIDWYDSGLEDKNSVPDSCCLLITPGCGHDIRNVVDPADEIITEGCLPTIMKRLRQDFTYYGLHLWMPVLIGQICMLVLLFVLLRRGNKEGIQSIYQPTILPGFIERSKPKYIRVEEEPVMIRI